MEVFRSRLVGISVAVAHGVFSGSLNILLKFLITNYHFNFLTLIQLLTSSTAAISLELLRRLGKIRVPAFSAQLCKVRSASFTCCCTSPSPAPPASSLRLLLHFMLVYSGFMDKTERLKQ